MAALNYAKQYSEALAQAYPYTLYFGDLYATPNNGRYRVVNAKTIEIPVLSTTGRVDADRDTVGAKARNFNNSWETKVLTNERQWSTLIHPKDIDQTNMVASISNITKVFNEEQKFPEMDAYLISTLHSLWATAGGTADNTVPSAANVLARFDAYMLAMDEARVPMVGRILYVTPVVDGYLKTATGLVRNIDVQSRSTEVNRAIAALDMVKIVKVPSNMMQTVYDFTTGWAVGGTSKQINMALVHPDAIITPVNYEFASLDEPSATNSGKYYYYEESHEDVFILNNKKGALMFNVEA